MLLICLTSDILGTFNEHRTSYEYTSLADVSVQYSKYGYTAQHKSFYGYNAESYSEKTGNIYLRNRFLNTKRQQFLSEDTYRGDIKDPLSLNRYNYAKGNPLKYQDPSGNFSQFQMQQTVNAYGFKIIHNRFNGIFNSVVSSAKAVVLWFDDIMDAKVETGVGAKLKYQMPITGAEWTSKLFGASIDEHLKREDTGESNSLTTNLFGLEELTFGLKKDENGKITFIYPLGENSSIEIDDEIRANILGIAAFYYIREVYVSFDLYLNISKLLGIIDKEYLEELIERARIEGGYVRCDLFD